MRLLNPDRSGPLIESTMPATDLAAPPAVAERCAAPPDAADAGDAFTDPWGCDWPAGFLGDDSPTSRSRTDSPAIGPDGIHRDPPSCPPVAAPAPCPTCGCVFWWQDIGDVQGDNLHCCECVAIPSRKMAKGSWAVVLEVDPPKFVGQPLSVHSRAAWHEYSPVRWHPFAHLDAERIAAQVEADSKVKF